MYKDMICILMYKYDNTYIVHFDFSLSNPMTIPLKIIVNNILVDICYCSVMKIISGFDILTLVITVYWCIDASELFSYSCQSFRNKTNNAFHYLFRIAIILIVIFWVPYTKSIRFIFYGFNTFKYNYETFVCIKAAHLHGWWVFWPYNIVEPPERKTQLYASLRGSIRPIRLLQPLLLHKFLPCYCQHLCTNVSFSRTSLLRYFFLLSH